GRKNHGQKALIRTANGRHVGIVREAIEQGRERMIFASEEQRPRLPERKSFRRRAQAYFDCSDHTPERERVEPPGCCVRLADGYALTPMVKLCEQGLHRPVPAMWAHA